MNKHCCGSLPGLSRQAQGRLWIALQRRRLLPREQRECYRLPPPLARSRVVQGWWALLTEFQDRPVFTALGLLATITYPVLWLLSTLFHRTLSVFF